MSTNVKIEDLFKKDIKRQIDGVIKVDKYDDESVYTELDELRSTLIFKNIL